ncbi:hypothetical protein [Phaeobacter inhibens]|uniref:hypothetical protein n=1 Tax=Phaeobacter inhibens TaxID=221822 RepID=UPI0021A7A9C9|nr:hypothetical protein [Phaeobacter inhibens]UWR59446.1 hypothetical protein K4F88_10910 [Phaeobacter inhibens]
MTVLRFTPPGRIPNADIDALLAQYEPDEWLPVALRVPLLIGLFACGLMAIALGVLIFAPQFTQAALTIAFLWPIALAFSVYSMNTLARRRRAEAHTRRAPTK